MLGDFLFFFFPRGGGGGGCCIYIKHLNISISISGLALSMGLRDIKQLLITSSLERAKSSCIHTSLEVVTL